MVWASSRISGYIFHDFMPISAKQRFFPLNGIWRKVIYLEWNWFLLFTVGRFSFQPGCLIYFMCLPKNPKILAAWVLANVSRLSVLKTFRFYPVLQMLLHTVKSCDKYFSVNIKYLKNKRMTVLSLVIHWLSATSVFMYRT